MRHQLFTGSAECAEGSHSAVTAHTPPERTETLLAAFLFLWVFMPNTPKTQYGGSPVLSCGAILQRGLDKPPERCYNDRTHHTPRPGSFVTLAGGFHKFLLQTPLHGSKADLCGGVVRFWRDFLGFFWGFGVGSGVESIVRMSGFVRFRQPRHR